MSGNLLNELISSYRKSRGKVSERLAESKEEVAEGICTETKNIPETELMFDRKSIYTTTNCIMQLFRLIMFKLRITEAEYMSRVLRFHERLGMTTKEAGTPSHNARTGILRSTLSGQQLQRNIEYLGYEMVDMSITLRHGSSDELIQVSLSEMQGLVQQDRADFLSDQLTYKSDEKPKKRRKSKRDSLSDTGEE